MLRVAVSWLRSSFQRLNRVMAEGPPAAKRVCIEGEGEEHLSEKEKEKEKEEEKEETTLPGAAHVSSRRRKCILLLAYNGRGYLGMQRNPGAPTIEEELITALVATGAVPDDNLGKAKFQRCSRTDKGVSAARQVVSLKMAADPSLVEQINAHLPAQIRVFGLQRVNRAFNSKNACSGRTYEYLLPTYAFAPFRLTTLDYRIDDVTVSRVRSLLQLYVGTHNFHNFTSGKKFEDNSSNRYIISFECDPPFLAHSTCGTCSEKKEVEFMALRVKGQSFVIHQIRKMIGLVIAILRGSVGEEVLAEAYTRTKIDIPRAPALGLLLENVHFDTYNKRLQHFAVEGIHRALDWSEYEEELSTFKREHIHQSIIDTEISQLSMMQWIGSLQIHDFHQSQARQTAAIQQQQASREEKKVEKKEEEVKVEKEEEKEEEEVKEKVEEEKVEDKIEVEKVESSL